MMLRPQKKTAKRLREVLNQLYSHLDSSGTGAGSNADVRPINSLHNEIQETNQMFHIVRLYYTSDSVTKMGWKKKVLPVSAIVISQFGILMFPCMMYMYF